MKERDHAADAIRYSLPIVPVCSVTVRRAPVTTISEKGQVVIPQSIRKELGIQKPKFLIYGKGDTVIMKKLELPDLKKEWDDIFAAMDKKANKLSEEDIPKEIAQCRKEKREE